MALYRRRRRVLTRRPRRRVVRRRGGLRRRRAPYVRRRNVRRRRSGRGLWDLIKRGNSWLRNTKLISTVGNALSAVPGIGGIAGTIGKTAATLGYGRRAPRRRRRAPMRRRGLGYRRRVYRRRGGSLLKSLLSRGHSFVKDNRLISKGLSHFGHSKLASAASALGYGRRRGRGNPYSTTYQIAAMRF